MDNDTFATVYRVAVLIALGFLCMAALNIGQDVQCIQHCFELEHAHQHCDNPTPPAPSPPAPQNPKPNNNPGAAGPVGDSGT